MEYTPPAPQATVADVRDEAAPELRKIPLFLSLGAIAEGYYGVPTQFRGAVLKRLTPDLRDILHHVADCLELWRQGTPTAFSDLKV